MMRSNPPRPVGLIRFRLPCVRRLGSRLLGAFLIAVSGLQGPLETGGQAWGQAAPAKPTPQAGRPVAKPAELPPAQTLELRTSDGLTIAGTYYPPMPEVDRLAAILLIHDLGGSHATVEPLARLLQRAGCDVLAPDLRGHGGSPFPPTRPGGDPETRSLRKPDFDRIIAASPVQQVREQATIRGDIEAGLLALLDRSGPERPPVCVVGSGIGGTLAALWTISDWEWRRLTTGQQGQYVKGLVLVSPVWADKGLNIKPALDRVPVRDSLPVLILAGDGDKDATRVFNQFERLRPGKSMAIDLAAGEKPDPNAVKQNSVFFFRFGSPLRADKLASETSLAPPPATLVFQFLRTMVQ
jgi:pimeloyl-ACP methyl ester carboxylesterase